MQTPPPTVPGIEAANSSPDSPAARARCAQSALAAPPPATIVSPSIFDRGQLALEPERERLDALVGDEQVGAEAEREQRQLSLRRPDERLLNVLPRCARARSRVAGPPLPKVV